MKRLILFLLFSLIFLAACGKIPDSTKLDPERYHSGTDMQYFQITYSNKISRIQDHENGCYFYHDGFLYSLDVNEKTIQPVCSKANCLHDRESDPERRKACHAFVSDQDPDVVSVMLYQDQLFVCIDRLFSRKTFGTVDKLSFGHSSIIRIASDGSSRELFYENEDIQIDITMLHRGYIYFQ